MLNLSPVTPELCPLVRRYTAAWGLENSEYTFTSLIMWGKDERIRICEQNGTLFILYTFPSHPVFMLAPLTASPDVDYAPALELACETMREFGAAPMFRGVSGPLIPKFEAAGFELTPDRDNFDYVYAMTDLRDLSGKKFHGKRNHINKFEMDYSYEYVPITAENRAECLEVYDQWLSGKDSDTPGVTAERDAIRIGFRHMEELGLFGGGIRMDGTLRAFTLAERISPDMAVVHIEKAEDIPGLYPVINQQFVQHALQDVTWINREEDMGLEGLRRAKLSYNPARMVEKMEAYPRV